MINKEEIDALENLKCFEPDNLVECALYFDVINIITNLIERQENRIKELEKERDYYKKRYLEFNNAFIKGRKEINKGGKHK